MSELSKAYDPAAVEADLYEDWLQAGLFSADPDADGEPFSIVIPPPNVTGALHIGHALTNAIEDAMVRRARMQGRNAVWVPGMDHAGIATQNVVEKQLAADGLTRHDLGREAFVERVWTWRDQSGGMILQQLRKLGSSLDWDREAFTFDEPRSRAVRAVFTSLYDQGLIYRGNRLINWCPRCNTALSDIEVEHDDAVGELARFRYPFADDPDQGIEVATTRAETMLGDTAIAVHPDDERYTDLVGRHVRHPFQDRTFPIVADDYVDPEFGSGAVKITPAHDPNDHAIALRHDLEILDIMADDATLTDVVGAPFAGLDRFEARTRVKEELDALGLLLAVDEHEHAVGHCSRCGTVVEPRLSDQWFVEVRPLADKAAAAVRDGRTVLVPERFTKRFLDWLDNLHDWTISRQIWWGHRIPAWYCPDGHITVAQQDPTSCAECGAGALGQDPDVLDTWFSSALWPFTVFGWEGPDSDTAELRTWYPTAVLETGYDINTFWVSRMLMMGLWFLDDVPFRVIYNHGMVRDQYGKKMSKSFGNVIDPLEFIDAYGADALRFALFQHCSPGTDVPLAPEWVEGAKRFTNKLWNIVGFALRVLDDTRPGDLPPADRLLLEDRWILSALEQARRDVEDAYETWDWARIAGALYHFAWDELADWYLEAVKPRVYGDDPEARATVQAVLARVLDDLLRLLHPLTPFVTEELWRTLTGASGGRDSLMVAAWPQGRSDDHDASARADFGVLRDLVTEVRRFRSQNGIAPSARFELTLASEHRTLLEEQQALIGSLAGLSGLTFVGEIDERPGTSTIVFGGGSAQVELAGLIDVEAELGRLTKELAKAEGDLQRVENKLGNASFVERAPTEVVDRERARREELHDQIGQLRERVDALSDL
ncbi:valine--tRNA ligase [Egicoccus halophilus]|uniref:Valine--tRNA ligase n=1 Tax=Egicoccus halophilus TaxID=1670830 RepID=A0A8J3EXY9_9ACTN|nr:valine--tRNA ligase [Egicoccus halophilus]GGI06793.1 valine--tRNA ligase [Egicoccus halophilus]